MRKLFNRSIKQEDGSVLVENIFVGNSISTRTLDEKFGIREEGFYDRENEIELTLSAPKIFRCDSTAIRAIAQAKANERVYVVRQIHSEKFV